MGSQRGVLTRTDSPTGSQRGVLTRTESPTGSQRGIHTRTDSPPVTQRGILSRTDSPTGSQRGAFIRSDSSSTQRSNRNRSVSPAGSQKEEPCWGSSRPTAPERPRHVSPATPKISPRKEKDEPETVKLNSHYTVVRETTLSVVI